MTTLEGNKLIAEFMGLKNLPYDLGGFFDIPRYHSSWNELMPVVYKILFETETNTLDVYSLYVSDSLKTVNINDVWMAVIEFLQWYNQQGTKINR